MAALVERIGRASTKVVVGSVHFGTLSHIALDAMMHADMAVALIALYPHGIGSNPGTFSEHLSTLALMLSPFVWLLRRKLHQLIREERLPRF